jgi:hypothetical protein
VFTDSDADLIDQSFNLNRQRDGIDRASALSTDRAIEMQNPERLWLFEEQLDTPSGLRALFGPTEAAD